MKSSFKHGIGLGLALAFGVPAVSAAIVQMREPGFPAGGDLITFSEVERETPTLPSTAARDSGEAVPPAVPPGGIFFGRLSGLDAGADCAGALACLAGSLPSPAPASPAPFIVADLPAPILPALTLTGASRAEDPIARLFGEDYFHLGLPAGVFDAARPPAITAFAQGGSLPGAAEDAGAGLGGLGLASKGATIPGTFLAPAGSEPAGIDNAGFGGRDDGAVDPVSPVPLPAGLPLLLAGLGTLGIARRLRRT